MSKHPYILSFLILLSIYSNQTNAQNNGFALLELYTSEGCSSCPPAERLMPELQKAYGSKLLILEFHVDYWDRLGWKDRFSTAQFSDRQREYTSTLNTNSVYTPQAIINGQYHEVGSRKKELKKIIDIVSATKHSDKALTLTAKKKDENTVEVSYSSQLEDDDFIYLALVQKEATTQVRAGENQGKLLKHYSIVRLLKPVFGESGKKSLTVPTDLYISNCYIVGFVQNTDNYKITAASKANIE